MDRSLEGKSCNILVSGKTQDLFFNVKRIVSVTKTHVSFLDRYNNDYYFRIEDIKEISNIR